jgi:hypothetical protein
VRDIYNPHHNTRQEGILTNPKIYKWVGMNHHHLHQFGTMICARKKKATRHLMALKPHQNQYKASSEVMWMAAAELQDFTLLYWASVWM